MSTKSILLIEHESSTRVVLHTYFKMRFAGAIAEPFNPTTLIAQVSHLLGWSD